jgi:hypothetical protein
MTPKHAERSPRGVCSGATENGNRASDVSVASARSKTVPSGRSGQQVIPLDLKPALAHLHPDEQATIRLDGVPEGLQFSAGAADGDSAWMLALADLDGLTVSAPADYAGPSPLSVNLMRRDPQGGPPQVVSNFGVLLTPDGATSAFSGLEPEEREGNFDSVVRLRTSLGKGRGRLKVKTAKRPLDFGSAEATAAFTAQRSSAHLEALFRGELAYNDGVTSEASLEVEQRIGLARAMWESEAAARLAAAQKEWEAERAQLGLRISDLEDRLRRATDEMARVGEERADWQATVRTKLIEVVTRLNDEHAAELAQIEQRLKQEAEAMIDAARADWQRRSAG